MKLKSVKAINFGSYKHLDFNYETEHALTLISGPTGSGKSTFQDIAFWGLFGQTAKGGTVDDIRSWDSRDPTKVNLIVETHEGDIEITRIRGKSNESDLFWIESGHEDNRTERGQTIKETQMLLEKRLGIDPEIYQTSAYCHEFSPSNSFFSSSARNQKETLDCVANLTWTSGLVTRLKEERKKIKELYETTQTKYKIESEKKKLCQDFLESIDDDIEDWDITHFNKIESIKKKIEEFDTQKTNKLQYLLEQAHKYQLDIESKEIGQLKICPTCKQQCSISTNITIENIYDKQISTIHLSENIYIPQLSMASAEKNPYLAQLHKNQEKLKLHTKACDEHEQSLTAISTRLSRLNKLLELTSQLKDQLLNNSIKLIEETTNDYLSTYFDSIFNIHIHCDSVDSEAVKVIIQQEDHECNFKQLSKGQRGLLSLCFSISVMQATERRSSIHFNELFFDEALTGFDAELKIKAYRLFEHLSLTHPGVYVIDHSIEFKELFSNKYDVTMTEEGSLLEKSY